MKQPKIKQPEIKPIYRIALEDLGIPAYRRQEAVNALLKYAREHRELLPESQRNRSRPEVENTSETITAFRAEAERLNLYRTKVHMVNLLAFTYFINRNYKQLQADSIRAFLIAKAREEAVPGPYFIIRGDHHISVDKKYEKELCDFINEGLSLQEKAQKGKRSRKPTGPNRTNPHTKSTNREQGYSSIKPGRWFTDDPVSDYMYHVKEKEQKKPESRAIEVKDAEPINYEERRKIVEALEARIKSNGNGSLRFGPSFIMAELHIPRATIRGNLNMLEPWGISNSSAGYEASKVLELARIVLEEQRKLEGILK